MEESKEHIQLLRQAVEAKFCHRLLTPKDFDLLAETQAERLGERVSTSTLKRIWGYVSTTSMPRRNTLDVLAQFVGASPPGPATLPGVSPPGPATLPGASPRDQPPCPALLRRDQPRRQLTRSPMPEAAKSPHRSPPPHTAGALLPWYVLKAVTALLLVAAAIVLVMPRLASTPPPPRHVSLAWARPLLPPTTICNSSASRPRRSCGASRCPTTRAS